MAANDPNQWLGLLRWSLAYQDGTSDVEVKEMDPETRKWLEEAMSELVVDEAKRMEEIVDQLVTAAGGESEEEIPVEALFEELMDMTEQIDQAMNIHKIGKFVPIINMLRNPDPVFRAHAAEIVATCSQNNPKVQTVAINNGALAYVTHLFVHEQDANVKAKALWALSCLVRNFPVGEGRFVEGDGVYAVCRGVRDADARVKTKSVYLLSYLLTRDVALRTDDVVNIYGVKIQETGLCTDLVAMVGDASVDISEGVLQALLKLVEVASPRAALLAAGLEAKLAERSAELSSLEGEAREDKQSELDLIGLLTQKLS